MKKVLKLRKTPPDEIFLTTHEFMESFNGNMPDGYPRVTAFTLQKFKDAHTSLFKSDGLWSLSLHRKRMIDWLPQNI
ncbi:hypothetical protein KW790_02690 [Candidatus Parcubacteria bacterium]|nr:hypothetical protein [Candidatus Parcubacteria bacterium]